MKPTVGVAIQLSTTVYPERCVLAAAEAYKPYCSVTVTPGAGDEIAVSLVVDSKHAHDGQHVLDEFLNYALDLSLRMHLSIEGDD